MPRVLTFVQRGEERGSDRWVLLGVGASQIISKTNGWPVLVSPASIAAAVSFSALVGIFFGFYPARKAAAMDPIEALRYE